MVPVSWCVITRTLSPETHSEAETSAQCSHKRSQICIRTRLLPAKSLKQWCRLQGSNPRPRDYKSPVPKSHRITYRIIIQCKLGSYGLFSLPALAPHCTKVHDLCNPFVTHTRPMPKLVRKPLTDLAVRKARPKEKRYDLFDAALRGFGMRVATSGAKTWFVMRRVNGRMVRYSLGRYPEHSLFDVSAYGTN